MINFWGRLPFRSVHSHFLTVCTAVFPNMYSEKYAWGGRAGEGEGRDKERKTYRKTYLIMALILP